jgi:ATP-dependent HslUV protease ATP-binding subunit HslU
VEATKFTEVGFHGKDVDQIIRDLLDISINMTKSRIRSEIKADVTAAVEEKLLDALVGQYSEAPQRASFKKLLTDGQLEDRSVEIEIPTKPPKADKNPIVFDGASTSGFFAAEVFKVNKSGVSGGKKPEKKKMLVSEARPILEEAEADKLLEEFDVTKEAISAVEESGIVFIDEIDKLISGGDYRGADASSEGVQRDLLPLIEGSTISTKHGNVNTDFILFVAS